MINLFNCSEADLTALVAAQGEPRYRVLQLLQWIYQRGATSFDEMTNLSRAFRAKLAATAEMRLPEMVLERIAPDGTYKWLLQLADGNRVETVFIPEQKRGTLCVSSQVGCALNCSFCATGKAGFNRNLTLAEIMGQMRLAIGALGKQSYRITNVVMMGMGEPLLNYRVVVDAMHLLMHDHAYGLSKYRVTLSTAGVIPALQQLRTESPVAVAISLHAPTNALRNVLVPLNKKYPLEVLIPLCRNYFPQSSRRRIMFEYVLLNGINDDDQHATQLIALLKEVPCKINLIPFNPFPGTQYQRSSAETVARFQARLIAAGFNAHVRRTRGDAINGACGQLAGDIQDRTDRHARWLRTGRLVPMSH